VNHPGIGIEKKHPNNKYNRKITENGLSKYKNKEGITKKKKPSTRRKKENETKKK